MDINIYKRNRFSARSEPTLQQTEKRRQRQQVSLMLVYVYTTIGLFTLSVLATIVAIFMKGLGFVDLSDGVLIALIMKTLLHTGGLAVSVWKGLLSEKA